MDELEGIQKALEAVKKKENNEYKLKTAQVVVCSLCGSDYDVCSCMEHRTKFCFECLKKTHPVGEHGMRYVARCKKPTCSFNRLSWINA